MQNYFSKYKAIPKPKIIAKGYAINELTVKVFKIKNKPNAEINPIVSLLRIIFFSITINSCLL
jgi:hypothetical protein|tara:strand:- start:279 stop:467 length:189 start_codon:yes stop_codon:yes gene_type:complete